MPMKAAKFAALFARLRSAIPLLALFALFAALPRTASAATFPARSGNMPDTLITEDTPTVPYYTDGSTKYAFTTWVNLLRAVGWDAANGRLESGVSAAGGTAGDPLKVTICNFTNTPVALGCKTDNYLYENKYDFGHTTFEFNRCHFKGGIPDGSDNKWGTARSKHPGLKLRFVGCEFGNADGKDSGGPLDQQNLCMSIYTKWQLDDDLDKNTYIYVFDYTFDGCTIHKFRGPTARLFGGSESGNLLVTNCYLDVYINAIVQDKGVSADGQQPTFTVADCTISDRITKNPGWMVGVMNSGFRSYSVSGLKYSDDATVAANRGQPLDVVFYKSFGDGVEGDANRGKVLNSMGGESTTGRAEFSCEYVPTAGEDYYLFEYLVPVYVTYDANGGTGTPPAREGYDMRSKTARAASGSGLTNGGASFIEWNTEGGTTAGTPIAAGALIAGGDALNGDKTLYAQYGTPVPQYSVDGGVTWNDYPTGGKWQAVINAYRSAKGATSSSQVVGGSATEQGTILVRNVDFDAVDQLEGRSRQNGDKTFLMLLRSADNLQYTTIRFDNCNFYNVGEKGYNNTIGTVNGLGMQVEFDGCGFYQSANSQSGLGTAAYTFDWDGTKPVDLTLVNCTASCICGGSGVGDLMVVNSKTSVNVNGHVRGGDANAGGVAFVNSFGNPSTCHIENLQPTPGSSWSTLTSWTCSFARYEVGNFAAEAKVYRVDTHGNRNLEQDNGPNRYLLGTLAPSESLTTTRTDWPSEWQTAGRGVYVTFTPSGVTVALHNGEGASAEPSSVTVTPGAAMPTLSAVPTRPGYVFDGYSAEGWEVTKMAGQDTDIITDGNSIFAYGAVDSNTLNGVTFENKLKAGADNKTIDGGKLTFSHAMESADGQSSSPSGVSADYQKLMMNKVRSTGDMKRMYLTLGGLTENHTYLVQIVSHECYSGHKVGFLIDGVEYECNQNVDSSVVYGRSFVHRFTAKGTTYTFPLVKIGTYVHINAIQLRDVSTIVGSSEYYSAYGESLRTYPTANGPTNLFAQWKCDLPEGYTQLDKLHFDGTHFILTDYKPTTKTWIETDMQVYGNKVNGGNTFFGLAENVNWNGKTYLMFYDLNVGAGTTDKTMYGWLLGRAEGSSNLGRAWTISAVTSFESEMSTITFGNDFTNNTVVGGIEKVSTAKSNGSDYLPCKTAMVIGGLNGVAVDSTKAPGYGSPVQPFSCYSDGLDVYAFKIYENDTGVKGGTNETLVHEFIPAKQTNGGVDGLYDLIEQEFYPLQTQTTVTLRPNGGNNLVTNYVYAIAGEAMPTVTEIPTKTGYEFQGYFTAASGGTKYYNADGTSAKKCDLTNDTTLYAQWKESTIYVDKPQQGTPTSWVYDATNHKPVFAENVCYTITYSTADGTPTDSWVNAGCYKVTFTLNPNCAWNGGDTDPVVFDYSITKPISDVTITDLKWWWDNYPHQPTVTDGDRTLVYDVDFTAVVTNEAFQTPCDYTNIVGSATTYDCTLTGKGCYTGTTNFTFTLARPTLKWTDTCGTNLDGVGKWNEDWKKPEGEGYSNSGDAYDWSYGHYPRSSMQKAELSAASGKSLELDLDGQEYWAYHLYDASAGKVVMKNGTLKLSATSAISGSGEHVYQNMTFTSATTALACLYPSGPSTVVTLSECEFPKDTMVFTIGFLSYSAGIDGTFRIADGLTALGTGVYFGTSYSGSNRCGLTVTNGWLVASNEGSDIAPSVGLQQLALNLALGDRNTVSDANALIDLNGTMRLNKGSTLTVDAGRKDCGTYKLIRVTGVGTGADCLTFADLIANPTVTNILEGKGAQLVVVTDGDKETGIDLVIRTKVAKPTVTTSFIYDETEKTAGGVATGYTVTGDKATNVGRYEFVATLADGYCWSDGAIAPYHVDWSIKAQVTFDANGGSGVSPATLDVLPGDDLGCVAVPTMDGHVFAGYFTAQTGGVRYYDADGKGVKASDFTENATLYAHWMERYEITYDGLEGATHENPAQYTAKSEIVLRAPTKRDGYVFGGWQENGAPISYIRKGTMGNKTLTATWVSTNGYQLIEYIATTNCQFLDTGVTPRNAHFGFALDFWDQCYVNLEDQDTSRSWYNDRIALGSSDANGAGVWVCNWNLASFHGQVVLCHSLSGWDYLSMVSTDPCLRNDVRIRMKIVNDTEGEAYSKGGITPTDTTSYYIYTLDKVNDDLSTEQVTKSYKQIWYGGTDLYADRPEWFAGSVIVGGAHQVDGSGVTNVVRYTNDNPTTVNKNFMRFYRVTFYYDDIVLYDAIPAVDSNGHVGLLRVDGTEGELFAYSKTIQQDWLDAGNEPGAEFAAPHFIVNGNGGEPGETVVIKVLDEAAQPALTLAQLPTREEWTLTGFTANADGTGVKYFDADGTRLVTPADGAVVYAQWEQQRVILDDNGGAEGDGSVPLTDGVPEASSVTRPFRNGWSFRGYWTTKDDDTGAMIYDQTGALVANPPTLAPGSTIYAHWEFVVTYYLAGTDQPKDSLPKTYSFYCTPTNENGTLKSSKKGWAEAKGGESVRHIVEPGHKYVAEAFLNTPQVTDGSVQEFPGDELYLSSWLELYSDVRFKKLITGGLKTVFCVDANNCDVTVSGAVEMESGNTLEMIVCAENRRLELAATLTGDETTVIKLLGQNQKNDSNLGYVFSGDASGFKGRIKDGIGVNPGCVYHCMFDVSFTGSFGGSVESFPTNVANAWFNYDGLPDTRTTRGLTMSCETPADVASVTNNIILYSDSPSVDFDASNFPLMTFPAGTAVDPAQFTVCHATEVGGEKTAFEDLYAIRNADETITLIANAQIVTLDDNGGAEGDGAVLLDNGVPPASVSRPFYNGWSFRGYWTTKDDDTGAMIYDQTGTRVANPPTLAPGSTIYAHWEFVEIYYLAGPDQGADPSFDGTPPGKEDTVNGWAEEPNGPAVRHTVEPGHKYTTKNGGKGYSLFTPSNQDGEVHSFLGDELTVAGTFALQESINVTNMIANGASIYTWKNGYHYIVDGQITVTNNSTLQLTGVGTDRTLEIRAKVKSGDGEIIALHGQTNADQRNLRFIISGDMSEFKGTWTKSSTEIAVPTTIDFSGSFGGRIKCFPTNMVNVLVNHDGLPESCEATGLPVTAAASADDVRSVQTNVTFYSKEVDFNARLFPLMTFPASVAAEVDPAQFTVYHAADTNGTKTAFANLGVRKNGDGTITLVANSVLSAIRENGPEIHFWNLDWIAEVCPGEKTAAEYQAAFLKTNAQGVVTWQAYVLGYEPNEVATAAIVEETVQNANPDTVTVRLRDMPENPRTNDQVSVRYTLLSARTTSDFQAGLAKVVINLDDDPYELWPVSTFEAPLRDLTGDKPLNYYQIKARFFFNRPIYDEEVDWLRIESQDDDDYIDTGIKITHDMRIETKVMLETPRQSYSRFGFDDSIVKGQSVVGDEHGFTRIMFSVAQDTACFGFQSSGNVTSAGFVSVDEVKNTELVIAGDYNRYTVNDTEYSTYGNHIPNDPDVGTMKLMAFGNGRFSTETFAGKMWYFRLYKGDELIADFVPVKFTAGDGEVEYAMYDKVGGMLHRNHGTGSFTGGPAVQ